MPPKRSRTLVGFTCSLFQDHLYFFGSFSEITGEASASVHIYSLLEDQWIKPQFQGGYFGHPRFGHTASVYKNMTIYYGGKENPRSLRCLQTTNVLVIDPENPASLRWLPEEEIQKGPPECITHSSHIYDDKMFIFQQNNPRSLSYLDLNTKTWSENLLVEGTANGSNRFWVFSENKLFGFHREPQCKESRRLQMLDLDSPARWQEIDVSGDSAPQSLVTTIYTELYGIIYILSSENTDQGGCKLWSYDTRENSWKALEDSGSLIDMSYNQCYNQRTLVHKNRILAVSAELQEPCIEILHATLNEEDMAHQSTKNQKEICKEKPEGFIKDSKDLFAGMLFTDVIFEVEDQHIPAHKSILAYRSQYFMNLFTEDQKSNKIEISDIKPHLFRAILQYIYCNEIELDEQLALELLPILDRYLLENLRGICEKYLAAQIRKDNVISLLITADNYKIQKLKEACFRYIVKNLQNVSESDEIMELSKPLFLELLKFQNPPHHQPQEIKSEPKIETMRDVEIIGIKKRGRPKKC